ncbi:unnamed protein product (macronuclear) [Paramecium tetraurelia]|uniref:Uncharacterized protein n=1 Tax=Paramecium tetraurelia TaxID=5888 RepID=A0BGC5_PARTE|nr:uncharacterized protein GSPATT00028627001 [Paramecium tetraurelia]CAK57592.1 unnamed protein product [Paramecium tetraurelia]|eukprot:XP_001424990.1 hypothetical protein (macronuclear) [Paramecium tetraurelia strain d4-2]
MAYHIDLSQLKCIIDDTPQLKRDSQALFVMKASTDYFDANSTICECNEESEPYSFSLRFKVELKQDPITQSNEDKEFYNMGSSFGLNEVDNPKNLKCSHDINDNTKSDQDKHHQIKKRSVSVQTNKLYLNITRNTAAMQFIKKLSQI